VHDRAWLVEVCMWRSLCLGVALSPETGRGPSPAFSDSCGTCQRANLMYLIERRKATEVGRNSRVNHSQVVRLSMLRFGS